MYIVSQTHGDVHAEHPSYSNRSAYHNSITQVGAESVPQRRGASTTGSKEASLLLVEQLTGLICNLQSGGTR